MNVHLPVSAVVGTVVQFKLEGCSVPDMIISLGDSQSILRESLHNPGTLLFVSIPQHKAAGFEAITNKNNLLVKMSPIISDIVGGCPMSTILSPPVTLNGESLRQREMERIGDPLGESRKEVHACMSFPRKSPVEIGQAMLSPALSSFSPVMLTVTTAKAITSGINAFVAKGSKQAPGECLPLLRVNSKVPVDITDSLLLVVPVGRIVLSLKILQLPVVAIDHDAGLPELDVLMDMSGVGATTFNLHGDNTMDIDLSVTSLGGNPVRWVLATDVPSKDGPFGLEVLRHTGNVSSPCALSTSDRV